MRRRTLWHQGRKLISALAPTCAHVPASAHPRPTVSPQGAPPLTYYDAGGAVPPPFSCTHLEAGDGFTVERTLLPPRLPDDLQDVPLAADPIELIHYRPVPAGPTSQPLVLMSPILGNTVLLVDSFARGLARRGIHGVIVQRKELAFDPDTSVRQAEEEVRLVVMRSRQAIDHLATRDDVDVLRMGSFGLSAGAIVSSMVAGADPRLRSHVWMMAGGPLTDVMIDTVEGRFRNYQRAILATSPRTRDRLRKELRETIRTDPLRLASRVERDRVLLVLARFDRSVPYRYGLALWRALGKPERIICPFGHYSSLLLLPWLRERVYAYFTARFAPN